MHVFPTLVLECINLVSSSQAFANRPRPFHVCATSTTARRAREPGRVPPLSITEGRCEGSQRSVLRPGSQFARSAVRRGTVPPSATRLAGRFAEELAGDLADPDDLCQNEEVASGEWGVSAETYADRPHVLESRHPLSTIGARLLEAAMTLGVDPPVTTARRSSGERRKRRSTEPPHLATANFETRSSDVD
jgi:hypothetical protein